MISIQAIWAFANQLGFDPNAFLARSAEKAATHFGAKAAAAIGHRVTGSVQGLLAYWTRRIDDTFPEYLRERLIEVDEDQRPAVIEATFVDWLQAHTKEADELSRLLFRLVYLRALIAYCSDLPVVGGTETHLDLDAVWVPQTFRAVRPDQPRQRTTGDPTFGSLSQAIDSYRGPILLIGDSGAGKSTQLRKLVLDQARQQLEMTDFDQLLAKPLPVYVRADARADLEGTFTPRFSGHWSRSGKSTFRRAPFGPSRRL